MSTYTNIDFSCMQRYLKAKWGSDYQAVSVWVQKGKANLVRLTEILAKLVLAASFASEIISWR